MLGGRRFDYEMFRNYYDGRQSISICRRKSSSMRLAAYSRRFADNLCPPVVDAVADRLSIRGFGSKKGGKTASKAAQQIWEDNHMDRRAVRSTKTGLKLGGQLRYCLADRDTGDPNIWPQRGDLVTVKYDSECYDEILWELNSGSTTAIIRLNMYYPNYIEKYITKVKRLNCHKKASAFTPFIDDLNGETDWS